MNKPVLKGIDFGTEDLETFRPAIPDNFVIWLTLTIGPERVEGGQLFQVGVCTVTWLAHRLSAESCVALRHMLLVDAFDMSIIKPKILQLIEGANRSNWDESLQVLCRHFAWEYEDYSVPVPRPPVQTPPTRR